MPPSTARHGTVSVYKIIDKYGIFGREMVHMPCCVSYTFKFMYECNLNGDCCHARTCHFMQQLNTFIYSIRNYGNSFSLLLPVSSCSLFFSFSFHFIWT